MYPKSCLWHDYLVSYLRLAAVVSFLNSNICFSFLDLLRPLTSYCTNFLVTGFLSWFEFAHLWPCCCCSSCCFTEYTGFESSVPCCCSVAQKCLPLCDPMDCSTPSFPVLHHLPEFAQTHVRWVSDAIQSSHLLLSPSPPAFIPSQHQGLFQWVGSSLLGLKTLLALHYFQRGLLPCGPLRALKLLESSPSSSTYQLY